MIDAQVKMQSRDYLVSITLSKIFRGSKSLTDGRSHQRNVHSIRPEALLTSVPYASKSSHCAATMIIPVKKGDFICLLSISNVRNVITIES